MATNNFHSESNKYFAIKTGEDFEYHLIVKDLSESLSLKFGKAYSDSDKDDSTELRSYSSRVIGEIALQKDYGGYRYNTIITVVIRAGYYHGVNVDYYITHTGNGTECETLEDLEGTRGRYNDGLTEKKAKLYAKRYTKYAEDWMQKNINKLDGVLAEHSDVQLKKIGQFSNGEAVYQIV